MRINVSQQLRASVGAMRNYEMNEVIEIFSNGGSLVQGEVSLIRTNRGILARAKLHAEIELTCSRCLELLSYPLAISFEEEYLPTMDVVSGMALSLPDSPGSFTIDEYHILDLTEAIRQYGLLAIPMKPLCRDDCAGLNLIAGQS